MGVGVAAAMAADPIKMALWGIIHARRNCGYTDKRTGGGQYFAKIRK